MLRTSHCRLCERPIATVCALVSDYTNAKTALGVRVRINLGYSKPAIEDSLMMRPRARLSCRSLFCAINLTTAFPAPRANVGFEGIKLMLR
jgi:hypothetical protein